MDGGPSDYPESVQTQSNLPWLSEHVSLSSLLKWTLRRCFSQLKVFNTCHKTNSREEHDRQDSYLFLDIVLLSSKADEWQVKFNLAPTSPQLKWVCISMQNSQKHFKVGNVSNSPITRVRHLCPCTVKLPIWSYQAGVPHKLFRENSSIFSSAMLPRGSRIQFTGSWNSLSQVRWGHVW